MRSPSRTANPTDAHLTGFGEKQIVPRNLARLRLPSTEESSRSAFAMVHEIKIVADEKRVQHLSCNRNKILRRPTI